MRRPWLLALAVLIAAMPLHGCASRPKPPRNARYAERVVVATGYCKCGKCCNWKRNFWGRPVVAAGPNKGGRKQVGVTASGTKARLGTIAADTSVYPFGTIIHVPGYGYGRVEDRGGAIKGERIDLFFKSHRDALEWGRKKVQIKVWPPR